MNFKQYQSDFKRLLAEIGALLEAPVRPFQMSWEVEQMLVKRLRRDGRIGFGTKHAIEWIKEGRPGHEISIGVQLYRLDLGDIDIQLADVCPPRDLHIPSIWAVPVASYRRLYRELRKQIRESHSNCHAPAMREDDRQRLWDNTIGFLQRDHSDLRRFNIPQKRGVLLTGDPGNGKTMACRWLSAQCHKLGLQWESVSVAEYERARQDGDLQDLFQPMQPGIVVFDDFDSALRDRKTTHDPRDQNTFLTELDGLNPRNGVVYLFTSNLAVEELDPALRRPGRIDQVIHFPKPDEALRRQFICDRWPTEILARLNIDEAIRESDGLSFAELEEMRKLLVLRFLDVGRVEWNWAREMFGGRCDVDTSSRRIGFGSRDKQTDRHNAAQVAAIAKSMVGESTNWRSRR